MPPRRNAAIVGIEKQKILLEEFLMYLLAVKRYSNHTISAYRIDIAMFLSFCNVKSFGDIDRSMMYKWLTDLREKNYQVTSIKRHIASVRSFSNYLLKYEGIEMGRAIKYMRPKGSNWLPKNLDHEMVMKMVETVPLLYSNKTESNEWKINREQAIIILMYGAGLRINEALSITKNQISGGKDFTIVKGKGNKERIVPLLPIVRKYISRYLSECPFGIFPDKGMFLSNKGDPYYARAVQMNIVKIRRILKLPEFVTPHTMRHACATNLLNNGGNIRYIQALLGHKSLETTSIYTAVSGASMRRSYDTAFAKIYKADNEIRKKKPND